MLLKQSSILSLGLFVTIAGYAQNWTPDATTISKLESDIKPGDIPKWRASTQYPLGHSPVIAEYARYYVGYTANNRRMLRGEFIIPFAPKMKPVGIYVVGSEKDFPVVFDGGCGVVNVVYDVEAGHVLSLRCNGVA